MISNYLCTHFLTTVIIEEMFPYSVEWNNTKTKLTLAHTYTIWNVGTKRNK